MTRRGRIARFWIVTVLGIVLATPSVQAVDLWPKPASQEAEQVRDLFNIITLLAIFVFVFVEGLLLYVIFRFRKNRRVPQNETHRGHTKAEIIWTIIPAVILLSIGVMSAQTMEALDGRLSRADFKPDFVVNVTAFQWAWQFTYLNADGTVDTSVGNAGSTTELYVEKGKTVKLQITSRDVIHAYWVPEYAIKVDAVPGRVNTQWFRAETEGNFKIICAEFCYADTANNGHHNMVTNLVVCPAGSTQSARGYGECAAGNATQITARGVSFSPSSFAAKVGEEVKWVNADATTFHTVTPLDGSTWPGFGDDDLPGGATKTYTFTAPGEYVYYCEPHSFDAGGVRQGMVGTVVVTA